MEIKPHITLIIGLIAAAIACEDTLDGELQPIFDGEFAGKAGETVVSDNQENSLFEFNIVDIQESRCPSTVTCIRFGEVVVSTQLRFLDQNQFTDYVFCLGDCLPQISGAVITDTLNLYHHDDRYQIILKDVTPYPEAPGSIPPQEAVFDITRL